MTGHSNRTVLTGDNLPIHWQHRCLQMGPRTRRPPQRAKSRHMAQVPRHVHPPFRARLRRGSAAVHCPSRGGLRDRDLRDQGEGRGRGSAIIAIRTEVDWPSFVVGFAIAGGAAWRRPRRAVGVFIRHKRLKAPRSKTSTPMGRQPMGAEREDRR